MHKALRIGVTQRVIDLPGRGERRDALDQAWTTFLAECGMQILPLPNRLLEPAAYLETYGVDAIVLSGGGNISSGWRTASGAIPKVPMGLDDLASERDNMESALLATSIEYEIPVIGVCRGMQFMNLFYGGRLERIDGHAGVNHAVEATERRFCCDTKVNSFHNLGIPSDGLGDGLRVLVAADGMAEAFVHSRFPHLGIMWHPERNSPWSKNDVALFRKFLAKGEISCSR